MKRHRRGPSICMTVLAMGSTLANLRKSQALKDPGDLSWLENRDVAHATRP